MAQAAIDTCTIIRPISDLRTKLAIIEEEAKQGPVVLNRNGAPALIVQDYQSVVAQQEQERLYQKIREAEIWNRATANKTYDLDEVLSTLKEDMSFVVENNLEGSYANHTE